MAEPVLAAVQYQSQVTADLKFRFVRTQSDGSDEIARVRVLMRPARGSGSEGGPDAGAC